VLACYADKQLGQTFHPDAAGTVRLESLTYVILGFAGRATARDAGTVRLESLTYVGSFHSGILLLNHWILLLKVSRHKAFLPRRLPISIASAVG
jgi:hypothetical protein